MASDKQNYSSELPPVDLKTTVRYDKKIPTLISNTASNADEVTRWLLDWHDLPYREERHAPGLHVSPANKAAGRSDGIANNPVYLSSDVITSGKDGFFKYIEERALPAKSLLPSDSAERQETIELYEYFLSNLWRPVGRYVYSFLLSDKKALYSIVSDGVPWWEKQVYKFAFGLISGAIRKGLEIDRYPREHYLKSIEDVFDTVETRLADGRPYLMGEQFTIADIFFAVNAAPLVRPDNFGGAQGDLELFPQQLQETIKAFQARPAGQFAVKIYREKRPTPFDFSAMSDELGILGRLKARVFRLLLGPPVLSWAYALLAKYLPAVSFGNKVLISRYQAVREIGVRDQDFTIEQVNAKKMQALHADFFLGMDRGDKHDREFNVMRDIVEGDDLNRIKEFVLEQSDQIIAAALQRGSLDVSSSLNRPVLVRLIEDYFGVPLPSEYLMVTWMRDIFHDLFLNLGNNKEVHEQAYKSASELKQWIETTIQQRKKQKADGQPLSDNLLNRLLERQQQDGYEWLDDDTIRRNISGLIVGTVETTSGSVVNAIDEFFRRTHLIPKMATAVKENDYETVFHGAYEALRFNPFNPFILRYAARDTELKVKKQGRPYRIKEGASVLAGIVPAMYDPDYFTHPHEFSFKRENEYLHFGTGYHVCYGRHINAITIPALVGAVLSLKNVRRGKGLVGAAGLKEGPFVNNFVVNFDL